MRAWDERQPSRRWRRSVALALLLHFALWFGQGLEPSASAQVATQADALDALQISLDAPPGNAAPPGGGSETPEPGGPEPRVEKPRVEKPRVEKPRVEKTAPTSSPEPPVATNPPEPSAFDTLAALDASSEPSVPSAPLLAQGPRKLLIESRSAPSSSSASTSRGEGPGMNGGPGGPGAGSGQGDGAGRVVTRAFAFGGPTGAFRAEVCAIRRGIKSLKEVRRCKHLATFFANALDISPRGFSEGFPGVTDRTEWFAIRYRGKFTVKKGDYYRFRLLSDDGAILHIDGYPIIDNDGQHPPTSRQATIQLEAGEHDLFVSYYQGPRDSLALQLFVKGSDGPERLLGPSF